MAQAGNDYMIYKDPNQPINKQIKDLIQRMTLEEKIAQMVTLERAKATPEIMRDYGIGSVLSRGGSSPRSQATPQDWIQMVNAFQNGSLSFRLGIPMIYAIDNNVYKATIFPHNIGLGATKDPELVKTIDAATALEVRATGINYVLAPRLTVCRDPRWGRSYECYSEDPRVVKEMVTEFISGLQGEIPRNSREGAPHIGGKDKVVACAKHFAGDGGTTRAINENHTVIDRHGLLSNSIIKGVATVMVSYPSSNGKKMHAHHDGFVISDFPGIDKTTDPLHSKYTDSAQAGVQAGIDMFMIPFNHTEFIDTLAGFVKKSAIPMRRIDDAVRRILRVKFKLGLFENPMRNNYGLW
ncbi:hypothetical protein DITRI_Ditri14bG0033100 [Diplodiscus trichospermus]